MKNPSLSGIKRRYHDGFTLLELVVTTVISSMILIFLVQMFSSAQGIWLRVSQRSDNMTTIRTGLSIFTDDARDLYIKGSRKSRRVPLYITKANATTPSMVSMLTLKRPIDQDPAGFEEDASPGVCIVSYRVAQSTGGGFRAGDLIRSFTSATATSKEMLFRNPNFTDPPGSADQHWDQDLQRDVVTEEAVASSIVLFDVRPLRFIRKPLTGEIQTKPRALEYIFDVRNTNQWPAPESNPEVDELPDDAIYDPDYSVPDLLEVRLVVASNTYYMGLDSKARADLARNVFTDLKIDGLLDGKSPSNENLYSPFEYQSLTYITTSIAYE